MGNDIGNEFLEQTKYENLGTSAQKQGVPLPPLEKTINDDAVLIDLPAGRQLKTAHTELAEIIEKRESLRKYTDEPISLAELSYLLWGTQGIKTVTDYPITKRTVPSAGSRHPFETYFLSNNVEGIKPGLYRYLALSHQITKLPGFDAIRAELTEACLKQKHVFNSAVTFAWVAVPERTTWRYGQRGFRYLYLDAGHVCQNLYLLAETIDCGVCAIAAYDDDLVNEVLKLDGEKEFVIYLASLGKRRPA